MNVVDIPQINEILNCYAFSIGNGKSLLAISDFPAFWWCDDIGPHMQLDPTYARKRVLSKTLFLVKKNECHKYHTCNTAFHIHDGSKNML